MLIAVLVASASCSKNIEQTSRTDIPEGMFEVRASADLPSGTRTSIDGVTLSWKENDRIGISVSEGLQTNMAFKYVENNAFTGAFYKRDTKADDVQYCAYYPQSYSNKFSETVMTSTLPSVQAAPFDPSADFIVADTFRAGYDEDDMPELSFEFDNHLFAMVKIVVTNSDASLKDEKLLGVELSCPGGVLAGEFTTDLAKGSAATARMQGAIQDKVAVEYEDGSAPVLGVGVRHVIYAVVAQGTLRSISLTVKTTNQKGTIESAVAITLSKGCVTNLPEVDFGTLPHSKRVKTMAYWGDSLGSAALCSYLQSLLGDDWQVYRGGVAGDAALAIAGRQGGIPMCIGATNSFTLPADHTQKVPFAGLYSTLNSNGAAQPGVYKVSHAWWFKTGYEPRINPCVISFTDGGGNPVEVECEITFDEDANQHYIQRTTDGEAVTVPPLATVTSWGATNLKDADVVACYMGVNGHPADDLLSTWYDRMIEYATTDKFIVVGYHRTHFGATTYWTKAYHNLFACNYGANFLDLSSKWKDNSDRLLLQTGIYSDLSQKTAEDQALIDQGEMPAVCWIDFETNVHPNDKGYRFMATMVYEKMLELGYLE